MNKQKQYFINGLILIIISLISITLLPYCADKLKWPLEKGSLSEIEFFMLCAASIFFLFSPKYYKNQVFSILLSYFYYFMFLKLY